MDKDDKVNEGENEGRTKIQKSRCSSAFPFMASEQQVKPSSSSETASTVADFRTLLHHTNRALFSCSPLSLSLQLSARWDLNMEWWWTDKMGEQGKQDNNPIDE